ncbi:MAG: phage portal protein, partial [Thermodesulfobacteriota bacterium]|nr:phage portal protein [Thermodesulfobacteriota bacterium]
RRRDQDHWRGAGRMKEVVEKAKDTKVRLNIVDRAVAFFSPVRAAKRYKARAFMSIAGGYLGGSKSRRGLKMWSTYGHDADSDILPDLPTLRERSRDLIRNNPLATGAIKTKVTDVVGTGLRLQSRIDRDVLGMDETAADKWEAKTEREWRLFAESFECDVTRTDNFRGLTRLVYRQAKENGDVFVLLPRVKREHFPYDLRLQTVEADRVCNEKYAPDSETLAGGIETDKSGAPVKYHILKSHPGANRKFRRDMKWDKVNAFGSKLGLRNVIHLFERTRPGQSRGVPDLAPVIEIFKQLGRYTDAEIAAAVISSFFTVFIETESGESTFDMADMANETGADSTTGTNSDTEYKLAAGSIIGLGKGEKVHDTNPGRPNEAFDAFILSILRQIGVALEMPFEILVKHFTASYSAARAALLEFWKYVVSERAWLVDDFCQVVYEVWMYEAVITGRIAAPGFLRDPIIRKAYLGAQWVGPARGQIDELKEVKAAQLRIGEGISTLSEVTAEMTGGDWEKKHPQSVKEHKMRKDDGLIEKRLPETELDDGKDD